MSGQLIFSSFIAHVALYLALLLLYPLHVRNEKVILVFAVCRSMFATKRLSWCLPQAVPFHVRNEKVILTFADVVMFYLFCRPQVVVLILSALY